MPQFSDLSASARARAVALLESRLGPSHATSDRAIREAHRRDESEAEGELPDVVVFAETREHIQTTLEVARETGIPVTPRGGGTGRTGGAVPVMGGILLSTLGMKSIKEIDRQEGLARVEPGVVLSELHRAVEAEGWFYPPDPNSLADCAIGGNVAENAGGPRAFKYGVTRDYVLGVEAFLVGGQVLNAGRRTIKGVTGYDVTGVLVGSEGTLAVFGDVTLRLIPKPETVRTMLALFKDVRHAAETVTGIVAAGLMPRCLELLDSATLRVMREAGNRLDPRAGALLIIEVDGSPHGCDLQVARVGELCESLGAVSVVAARSAEEREKLWSARREMSGVVRKLTKYKLSEDVVVPRCRIPELIDRLERSCAQRGVMQLAYGHAGDGNLHVNFLWNEPEERPRVHAAIEQCFRDVIDLGGTLTGEHGIGVLKAPYLGLEQSPELIAIERSIKQVFDPAGLLNPGKIFTEPLDSLHRGTGTDHAPAGGARAQLR